MVGNIPVLKPQDVIRLLQRLGFTEVRQLLLRKIAQDIDVTVEALLGAGK